MENSQIQERRTSDYFVNADFIEEYIQMSVSHIDAFESKTNDKCYLLPLLRDYRSLGNIGSRSRKTIYVQHLPIKIGNEQIS